MTKKLVRVICFVLWSFLLACKPGTPSGVLSQSDMEEVLYDYHLAQSAAELDRSDVDRARYLNVQSVFQKHGITEAEFDSSMVWYAAHSEILRNMYERIVLRLENEATQMGVGVSDTEVYANLSQTGDTANIWSGQRILFLSNDRLHNLITITMPADSTFRPGDDFKLSFSSHFITNSSREAYALLSVFYTDGTSKSTTQRIGAEYDVLLSLPSDINHNNRLAQRLVISFYRPVDSYSTDASYFFVTNPALLRIHQKDEVVPVINEVPEEADTVEVDADTIDSIGSAAAQPRLSPTKLRDSRQVERTIQVVKERPLIRRQGRRKR